MILIVFASNGTKHAESKINITKTHSGHDILHQWERCIQQNKRHKKLIVDKMNSDKNPKKQSKRQSQKLTNRNNLVMAKNNRLKL